MKKISIFVIKSVAFVFIIILLTQMLGNIFARNNEGYLYSDIAYMVEKDAVDVVFIGSSHCYCTVIPQLIYDKTGIQSIVVADNMESTKSSYWAMREVADRFPEAKIFIELYTASTQYDENMHHNYYTSAVRRMPEWSIYKYLGLKDILGENNDINWQYYFRFFSARTQLFDLRYEDFSIANENTLLECKGYDPRFNIIEDAVFEKQDLTDEQKASIQINKENLEYIHKIIDFSNESGIEVEFFCSPYLTTEVEDYQYQMIENTIKDSGKKFLNFNNLKEELGMLNPTCYKDSGHTNFYGAKIVTEYLSQYLARMIPEQSIENREKSEYWELYRGCYNKWEDFHNLSTVKDAEEYFNLLEKYKQDIVVFMVVQDNYEALYNNIKAEKMTDLYALFGITENNTNRIFAYGACEALAELDEIKLNFGERVICLSYQGDKAEILVDGNDLAKKVNGINICVFNVRDMTLIDNAAVWNGTPNEIVR